MSSLVVFFVNFIIVIIFWKVKLKENWYIVKIESEDIDNVDIEIGEERKKVLLKKGFLYWFVYVVYVIVFVVVVILGFFVSIYGMVFGFEILV